MNSPDKALSDMKKKFMEAVIQSKQNLEQPSITEELIQSCIHKLSVIVSQKNYIRQNEHHANLAKRLLPMKTTTSGGYHSFSFEQIVVLNPENRVEIATLAQNPNKIFTRKFLLCRTITPASKVVGIETVVDDPDGRYATRLALYNYSDKATVGMTDFEDVLPTGSLLVLRNPWFKSTASGGLILRCDNPADVDLVSPNTAEKLCHELRWAQSIPNFAFPCTLAFWGNSHEQHFEKLKNLGNKAFVHKRYTDSIRWYDLALEYVKTESDKVTTLSNKAAALVALACYNSALCCTQAALTLDPFHIKSIYRHAKAHLGLDAFEQALAHLDSKLQNSELQKNKDLVGLRVLAAEMLQRKSSGLTPNILLQLVKSKKENPFQKLENCPEFLGPFLRQQIEGKGRGLIATEEIVPGQLLICTKAFAYFKNELPEMIFHSINYGTGIADVGGHDDLILQIVNKIRLDSKLGPFLYELTAGKELGHLENEDTRNQHLDLQRIDKIVTFNSFSSGISCKNKISKEWAALYLWPSFMNHSCSEANCFWHVYQDIMVVTAIKGIQKGEELLLPYVNPSANFERRQKCFESHELICTCQLCNLDSAEGKSTAIVRQKLTKRLESASEEEYLNNPKKLVQAVADISRLESLRKNNAKLNFFLLNPYVFSVTDSLFVVGRFHESLKLLLKMYNVAKYSSSWYNTGLRIAENIIRCNMCLKNIPEVIRWVNEYKVVLNLFYNSLEPGRYYGAQIIKDLQTFYNIDFFADY